MDYAQFSLIGLLFAVVSAKWAMELGFRQSSQFLWGIAGFFAGPVVLLILYVRLIANYQAEGRPGARW
jgi:hypothetical protein